MISPLSEFFIEKPVAKDKDRVSKGLVYLASRFKSIIPKHDKNKSIDGFELKEVWKNIVDHDIAKFSFPMRITKDGTLTIIADNSAIIPFIRYNNDKIVKDINLFFGKNIVKKISITGLKE